MSSLLIFSIFFAVLSILSTIFTFGKGKEGLGVSLILLAFLGNVIIWGPLGCEYPVRKEIKEIKCKVTKTDRVALVDDGSKIWEYTSHGDYEFINDSCKFHHVLGYNMYGGVSQIEMLITKNVRTK